MKAVFSKKRVLITGGLGFIGSNLARRLVDWEADVILIDSLMPQYGGNRHNIAGYEDRLRVQEADICNEALMVALVQGQDYVFNLAGQSSHLDSMQDPYRDLEVNCKAQLTVLEACRKHNPGVKIIYASTRQIYGTPAYLPVDEKHPVAPVDINGIHKWAGEEYHLMYQRVYGIQSCVLRLTNIYGPRMRVKDARQTFLGWWIAQVLNGQTIRVFGDGTQLRDLSYIDDAVEALLYAAATDACYGEIFNLGGDSPISLGALAELLVAVHGAGRWISTPFPSAQKAIDIGHYYANDQKFRALVGWRSTITVQEGLARTLAYYREHGAQYWDPTAFCEANVSAPVSLKIAL